jgi:oligopeptide/dipeptide ABC transporter ATP-binding protein
MSELLKVVGLKKHFPIRKKFWSRENLSVKAVDGLDLTIQAGETVGLVGESGSGKTTVGRLILRLITPTAGRIWFKDQEITDLDRRAMRPLRRRMQIVFQDPYSSLNPRMTVREIIGEGLEGGGQAAARDKRAIILDVMEKVGLRPEQYTRYPHEFSGGQRQRIAIARAIVLRPELVVADEPLSALDVSIQAQIVNLLEKLKEEYRLSYLFISHDLSIVEYLADRVAVMSLGKIVELAPRDLLYDRPAHPYTLSLFSAIPLPQVGKRQQRIILQGDIPSPIHPPQGCRFHPRCFRAVEICAQVEPAWREIADGHHAACHLY